MNRLKPIFLSILLLSAGACNMHAQQQIKETFYEYDVIVYERPSSAPLEIEQEPLTGQKGILSSLLDMYRSTFTGKVADLSAQILQAGINLIIKAVNLEKENYRHWQQTTNKELRFHKKLPMQTEITDFYQAPSTIGALDPMGIIFKGFGCRQYVSYRDENRIVRIPVIIVACSMDTTEQGKQRINHHSKFQITVDSILFNPFLCNLPNDSLNVTQLEKDMRIPFDFQRRQNLQFSLHADLYSSWINEAIMITHDQYLGSFDVSFSIIDSTVLDTTGRWKGYYTWFNSRDQNNPNKRVRVKGESFVVPRSFVSTTQQGSEQISTWGTGQYRINMSFTESCEINTNYYYTNGKPNSRWKEEWKQMKKRKLYPTFWDSVVAEFTRSFDIKNNQWIHTLLDPVQSALVINEREWLNSIIQTPAPAANTQQSE